MRWPTLPDDSAQWTDWFEDREDDREGDLAETADPDRGPVDEHLARLDREQRRRPWNG